MKLGPVVMTISLVLVFIGAAWYFHTNWDQIASMRVTKVWLVVALALLMAARMTLRGVFQWQMLRSVGSPIGLVETMKLNFAGLMLNQLLILPVGAGYRAAYMKKVHALPFRHFASTMAALYIYFLAASALLGLIAMSVLSSRGAGFDPLAGAVLIGIVMGCGLLVIAPHALPKAGGLRTKADRVLEGWHMIVRSPRLIVGASGVVFLSLLVGVIGMIAAFGAFGLTLDTPGSMLLIAAQRVGSLIRLTPGAVGFQEMVSLYYARMLAVGATETAVVLVLVRVVNIGVGILLGVPSLWSLQHPSTNRRSDDAAPVNENAEAHP